MKHFFYILPLSIVLFAGACKNNDDEMQPGKADLELSFEPIAEKPEIGGLVTFQANLYNRGPLTADGVTLENSVPEAPELYPATAEPSAETLYAWLK